MSTQQDHESRHTFSIIPQDHQQQFRLLELTPDILRLITSDDPPILQLKSFERTPGDQTDSNAVLCTPDKTFNLRQVNHSNSVFITRSSNAQINETNDHPQPGLEAIAQSTCTLELTPVKDVSAHAYLQAAVPLYLGGNVHSSDAKPLLSKSKHFANIPLDQHQCEQAWTEMTCFETKHEPVSFRPSCSIRNRAWSAMLTQAIAEGIDLTSSLSAGDVSSLIDLDEIDCPSELYQAILDSMTSISKDGIVQIDSGRCARLNGIALLQEYAKGREYTASEFDEKWADSLPEKWRSKADLELLNGSYKCTSGTISYIEQMNGDLDGGNAAAGTTAKPTAKRKWHEKFRASKKAA